MYEGSGQTVHDLSGKGNNGMLGSTAGVDANDPSWIRAGLFGSALRFGGDDFVRIAASPELSTQQVTVSSWVRATGSPGQWKYVIGRGAKNCEAGTYGVYSGEDGGLQFYIYDNDGRAHLSGAVPAATAWNGKWHHVAGTWDGVTPKLFFDGKLIPGASTAGVIMANDLPTSADVTFGEYPAGCDLFYTGDVDDVAIFSEPLPVDRYWPIISLLFPKPLR